MKYDGDVDGWVGVERVVGFVAKDVFHRAAHLRIIGDSPSRQKEYSASLNVLYYTLLLVHPCTMLRPLLAALSSPVEKVSYPPASPNNARKYPSLCIQ